VHLRTLEVGDGPDTVVLLHGFSLGPAHWAPLVVRLVQPPTGHDRNAWTWGVQPGRLPRSRPAPVVRLRPHRRPGRTLPPVGPHRRTLAGRDAGHVPRARRAGTGALARPRSAPQPSRSVPTWRGCESWRVRLSGLCFWACRNPRRCIARSWAGRGRRGPRSDATGTDPRDLPGRSAPRIRHDSVDIPA
jgi:hypothetical protein